MPKNLVICCDGTWNSAVDEEYGAAAPTNVHKLYQACLDQAESDGQQVTWYQPGVGALGSTARRTFEGATGTGVGANIRRGYMAIAWNYEPGDRIFLFGFSRGAFTARSIAGMIQQVGILVQPTAERVERAYKYYENHKVSEDRNLPDPQYAQDPGWHQGLGLNTRYARIHFIGVWDTVGSLGVSFWGWSFNLRLFFRNGFHDLSPNLITDHFYHALAMDEMRTSFMPTLWEVNTGETLTAQVEQAWFRGVHSDVGGGYAERGLADITYEWLTIKAQTHGLQLRTGWDQSLKPDAAGRIHRSLRGPLYTNVAGWPRWYRPRYQADTPTQEEKLRGYLHSSVQERLEKCKLNGSKTLALRTLSPGESATVEVPADQLWTNTGLILEEGATYTFEPSGVWQDLNDTPVGPGGEPRGKESLLKRSFRWALRAPNEPWMQLMGLVNYPRTWPWLEKSLGEAFRYLIWEDPEPLLKDLFPIKNNLRKVITSKPADEATGVVDNATGVLWVFANDLWKTHVNNTGSLRLKVTRAP
ncbi:DUF2235 domain-containing protein [Hymenobacter sp. GOD-10R]|uniref:DUF2235 domain-containing protein n=1 Tax=Hymenobacter sp. GOD-10R TaxID=3093922 RepID=UPI002D77D143|nr:DUF2235 domain-containing protein [Hymenobacter sp. GOD-10R]WRQ32001.1 DUF2235 domain-containing protein [Hymenobacter sp. GOD-10R]